MYKVVGPSSTPCFLFIMKFCSLVFTAPMKGVLAPEMCCPPKLSPYAVKTYQTCIRFVVLPTPLYLSVAHGCGPPPPLLLLASLSNANGNCSVQFLKQSQRRDRFPLSVLYCGLVGFSLHTSCPSVTPYPMHHNAGQLTCFGGSTPFFRANWCRHPHLNFSYSFGEKKAIPPTFPVLAHNASLVLTCLCSFPSRVVNLVTTNTPLFFFFKGCISNRFLAQNGIITVVHRVNLNIILQLMFLIK